MAQSDLSTLDSLSPSSESPSSSSGSSIFNLESIETSKEGNSYSTKKNSPSDSSTSSSFSFSSSSRSQTLTPRTESIHSFSSQSTDNESMWSPPHYARADRLAPEMESNSSSSYSSPKSKTVRIKERSKVVPASLLKKKMVETKSRKIGKLHNATPSTPVALGSKETSRPAQLSSSKMDPTQDSKLGEKISKRENEDGLTQSIINPLKLDAPPGPSVSRVKRGIESTTGIHDGSNNKQSEEDPAEEDAGNLIEMILNENPSGLYGIGRGSGGKWQFVEKPKGYKTKSFLSSDDPPTPASSEEDTTSEEEEQENKEGEEAEEEERSHDPPTKETEEAPANNAERENAKKSVTSPSSLSEEEDEEDWELAPAGAIPQDDNPDNNSLASLLQQKEEERTNLKKTSRSRGRPRKNPQSDSSRQVSNITGKSKLDLSKQPAKTVKLEGGKLGPRDYRIADAFKQLRKLKSSRGKHVGESIRAHKAAEIAKTKADSLSILASYMLRAAKDIERLNKY